MTKEGLVRVGVVAASRVLTAACPCGGSELYKTVSPKGTRTLVVCTRNCGATGGFTTVIKEQSAQLSRQIELIEIGGGALG